MKFFNNKIDIFWILQIAGWSTLHLVYFFLYSRSLAGGQIAWLLLFITQVTGFIVSSLLRYIYRKIDFQAESVTLFTLKILFWVLITSNVWFWIDGFFSQFINEQFFKDLTLNRYFSFVWSNTVIMSAWSALYFSIKFWQNWNLQRLKTEKANSLAHKSQLKLLRYQLNPHFLFNSLNSIRALIEEDKSRAKSMITELSEFLRYSLVNKNLSDIPLKEELEIMKHYFSIEKTRFEEKLEVTFNIDEESENILIPSFIIHPLIENAIKYGMKTTNLPLRILINTKCEENSLIIEVYNSGKWIEPMLEDNGTGTGLNNVKQRLINAYPNKHSFEILKNNDSVCVKIKLDELKTNE